MEGALRQEGINCYSGETTDINSAAKVIGDVTARNTCYPGSTIGGICMAGKWDVRSCIPMMTSRLFRLNRII